MRLKLKRKYLGMSAALSVAMVTAACGGAERTVKIQTQADPLLHLAHSDRDFETETDEAPGFGIKGFLDEFGYNDDGDDERFPLTSFEEARSERDNAVAQEVINCRSEAGVIGGTTADPDGPTSRTNDSESESHGRYHRDGETGDHGRYHRDPIRTAPRNCLSGHLEGRYIDLPNRNGGVFGGRWVTRRGRFVGHVVGRYRASRQGPNTFRGKIIRRNGRYIGRISGTWYGSNGAPTPLPGPMTAPEESEGNARRFWGHHVFQVPSHGAYGAYRPYVWRGCKFEAESLREKFPAGWM